MVGRSNRVTHQSISRIVREIGLQEARATGTLRHQRHDGITVAKHGNHRALASSADLPSLAQLGAVLLSRGYRLWRPRTKSYLAAPITEADVAEGIFIITR